MPPGSTSTRPGNPPPRFWDWPRPLPSAHRAAFFSFVEGVGGGDPPLGPLPSHPRRRARVLRIVSPETRLRVSPFSKLACAAISKVQRLVSYPNSLGERWSISLRASALSSSKAPRVLLGREIGRASCRERV